MKEASLKRNSLPSTHSFWLGKAIYLNIHDTKLNKIEAICHGKRKQSNLINKEEEEKEATKFFYGFNMVEYLVKVRFYSTSKI